MGIKLFKKPAKKHDEKEVDKTLEDPVADENFDPNIMLKEEGGEEEEVPVVPEKKRKNTRFSVFQRSRKKKEKPDDNTASLDDGSASSSQMKVGGTSEDESADMDADNDPTMTDQGDVGPDAPHSEAQSRNGTESMGSTSTSVFQNLSNDDGGVRRTSSTINIQHHQDHNVTSAGNIPADVPSEDEMEDHDKARDAAPETMHVEEPQREMVVDNEQAPTQGGFCGAFCM